MVRLATEAGIWHGYLENVVFSAELMRMRDMVEAGAIGTPVTFRAREAHSGPHAAHFWDAETAGGGALLDMASHGDRGHPIPLRQGRSGSATCSPGATPWSIAGARPPRTTP